MGITLSNHLNKAPLTAQHSVRGAPTPPLNLNGNYQLLRGKLRTSNWATYPGSIFRAVDHSKWYLPYSWQKKRRLIEEVKKDAILDVYYYKPNVNADVVGTFRRLNELQDDNKRGKTIEQCLSELERIKIEHADLRMQRDNFAKSGALQKEKTPKLNPAFRQAFLEAELAKELADTIAFDCSEAKEQATPAAAQAVIANAMNAVRNRYAVGSDERTILDRVGMNPGPIALVTNAVLGAVAAPGANAVTVANAAHMAANGCAKTQEKVLTRMTRFESRVFEAYALKVEDLEQRLRTLRGEIFNSLCNGDEATYENPNSFDGLYNAVFDGYNQVAEVAEKLDGFRRSLGLPALRKDKIENSTKYKFKQAVKESFGDKKKWWGAGFTAAELAGIYVLNNSHILPAGFLGYVAGTVGVVGLFAINIFGVAFFQYILSDD